MIMSIANNNDNKDIHHRRCLRHFRYNQHWQDCNNKRRRYHCRSSSNNINIIFMLQLLLLLQVLLLELAVVDGYTCHYMQQQQHHHQQNHEHHQQQKNQYYRYYISNQQRQQERNMGRRCTMTATRSTCILLLSPSSDHENNNCDCDNTNERFVNNKVLSLSTTKSSTATMGAAAIQPVWEESVYEQLQQYYSQAMTIKCPFFRRRTSDILDMIDMILQFIIITRHKSLSLSSIPNTSLQDSSIIHSNDGDCDGISTAKLATITTTTTTTATTTAATTTTQSIPRTPVGMILPPSRLGIQPSQQQLKYMLANSNNIKFYHLPISDIVTILQQDWDVTNNHNKGYYITGKITTQIYDDVTYFDSPDPDMPVRGLYKYMKASSQLFDIKSSYAILLSINVVPNHRHDLHPTTTTTTTTTTSSAYNDRNDDDSDEKIVVQWKIGGRLRLPWKPIVPEWTGTTTYYISKTTGLIYRHIETWDISVLQAFLQTLLPSSVTKYIF